MKDGHKIENYSIIFVLITLAFILQLTTYVY